MMELMAVVVILGIVGVIAAGSKMAATLSEVGSQTDANRLAVDLLCAQRRAIATGNNHYLKFNTLGGQIRSYTCYRVLPTGDAAVDEPRTFTKNVAITGTSTRAEFTFEGSAIAAYQYTLEAPNRSWQVSVVPATGTVRVTEL